jgi:hypothetical protein
MVDDIVKWFKGIPGFGYSYHTVSEHAGVLNITFKPYGPLSLKSILSTALKANLMVTCHLDKDDELSYCLHCGNQFSYLVETLIIPTTKKEISMAQHTTEIKTAEDDTITLSQMPMGSYAVSVKTGYIYYRYGSGAICLNDGGSSYTGNYGDISSCCKDEHRVRLLKPGTKITITVGK